MNKNISRIIFGSLFGIVIFTILLILLEKTPLLWTAYAWCVFAIVAFACSMGYWAKSQKENYILHAAYPMVVWSYLIITILVAVFFAALEYAGIWAIKFGWICLIEFIILAISAWKLQALDVAREVIEEVDQQVKMSTITWKMIRVDLMNIAENMSSPDKKIVAKTAEIIRYSDPMEHPAVADIVAAISKKINDLKNAVNENNSGLIAALCSEIEQLEKERKNKLMILK